MQWHFKAGLKTDYWNGPKVPSSFVLSGRQLRNSDPVNSPRVVVTRLNFNEARIELENVEVDETLVQNIVLTTVRSDGAPESSGRVV